MAVPASQKADRRPIAFYLDDQVAGETVNIVLVVRPEDLTRVESSLQTPIQTFGGAWLDDFGPGLSTIQISGHTGWNIGDGWEEHFAALRDQVWSQWHSRRAAAVERGRDPDEVRLIFADTLDNIVAVVAPGQFVLRRSKSRPLLMMYQISMTVLSDKLTKDFVDELHINDLTADTVAAGVDSLQDSLDRLTSAAARVRSFIDLNIAQPVQNFMHLTEAGFRKVLNSVNRVTGVVDEEAHQLISVATDLAMVGRNTFYTFNAVAGLPDHIRHDLSAVASAYENAFCVMRNAFRRVRQYPDYSDVYGASVCSSTIGGSPLSPLRGTNPFETIIPSVAFPPAVTIDAKVAIEAIKTTDPVLSPMAPDVLATRLAAIAGGVRYDVT